VGALDPILLFIVRFKTVDQIEFFIAMNGSKKPGHARVQGLFFTFTPRTACL